MDNWNRVADLVLRGGVAFAFLYPPISALYDPYSWLGYFPAFTRGYVPDMMLLHAFGVVEVIIALWILSGWKVQWPAAAAMAMLLAIVILDFSQFEVVFRDLSIAAAAAYLVLTNLPSATTPNSPVRPPLF